MNKFRIGSIVITLLIASLPGCDQGSRSIEEEQPKIEIPKLQDREAAIGSNEEMDMIRSRYNESVEAIKKNPNNIEAQLKLAEVFIAEGRIIGLYVYNYNAALQILDGILDRETKQESRFSALVMKGMVKLSLHQFKDALQTGQQAVQLNSQNSGVYGVLVDANVELGNYDEAVKMSDKMVSIRPDLRSYSRISYLREIHGEVKGAIEAMDMAVKAGFPGQEQTEWCRINLGKLYEKTGDLENAEMHYRIALKQRENYPFALHALANLERKKGNLQEAEKMLKLACGFIQDASFYEGLTSVYRDMKQDELRERALQKALRLMKGLESGTHGHEHEDDHGHSRGEDAHGHSHKIGHGHTHEVGLEMARLLLSFTEDYEKALENALHEYDIRPNNIEVNQVLATIYLKTGKLEEANTHLNKAQATNCQNADLLCLAGLIHIENGNTEEGTKLLKQSFETDPFQDHILVEQGKRKLESFDS